MKSASLFSSSLSAMLAAIAIACTIGCNANTSAHAAAALAATDSAVPVVDTVRVALHPLNTTISVPGELQPFEMVAIYPKVTGFVQWIGVDRGSKVHRGQLLARLIAPELTAQRAEAEAKLQSAKSRQLEAEAKTAADEATYQRIKFASATPGVISENELQIAQQTAVGDQARAMALRQNVEAARATLKAVEETTSYLQITAPFDGVVTDRNVHPGALVGPAGGGSQMPMLNISQTAHLRLIVAVPESSVAYISQGAKVEFTVVSYPGQVFHGNVARVSQSVEVKTRTMPVEMDVDNASGKLSPGMYPQVTWPEQQKNPTLFVPTSAIVHSTEETFVICIRNDKVEWVPIKIGVVSGNESEVFGNLSANEEIALRGSEELRPNSSVKPKMTDENIAQPSL